MLLGEKCEDGAINTAAERNQYALSAQKARDFAKLVLGVFIRRSLACFRADGLKDWQTDNV
jgi:hypothetical protein